MGAGARKRPPRAWQPQLRQGGTRTTPDVVWALTARPASDGSGANLNRAARGGKSGDGGTDLSARVLEGTALRSGPHYPVRAVVPDV
jgi:hypothetical protein